MIYQILALLIWSSSLVAAKFTYEMLDPVLMVQARMLIALIFVLPLFMKRWKKIEKPIRKQLWGLAFFNYTAVFLLQFIGLKYTSASSAVTMIGLEPLLVVFVGHFFFKDKALWYHWLFGAMAFIGLVVLISGGHESSGVNEISVFGCFLVFMASIVFASILRWTQRMIVHISTQTYTAITIVLGFFTTLPFTFLLTQSWEIHFNWPALIALFYLGVGCSWLAFWLWNKGLNSVSANLSGILTALEPIFGIFLAMILLGESLSLISSLGIAIIMAATLGSSILPRFLKGQADEKH